MFCEHKTITLMSQFEDRYKQKLYVYQMCDQCGWVWFYCNGILIRQGWIGIESGAYINP